jgi:hypothetical protein
VVWDWLVALLVSVTVTPGTTALAGSVTVPRNAPVVDDWAEAREVCPPSTTSSRADDAKDDLRLNFIVAFLFPVAATPERETHLTKTLPAGAR